MDLNNILNAENVIIRENNIIDENNLLPVAEVPMDIDNNDNVNANANVNANVNANANINVNPVRLLQRNRLGIPNRRLNDVIFEMGIRNLHSYDCFHNIAIGHNLTNGDADIAYFHHLCAGGTYGEIEHWISNYINIYGYNRFVEFANSPLYNNRIGYNITPIVSAVLWNSVEVLRLLYSFGLRLDQVDGFYPEETILYFPFVHPIAHMFPDGTLGEIFGFNENEALTFNSANNYRMLDDFRDIIDEIRYISGEALPPANWLPIAPRYR